MIRYIDRADFEPYSLEISFVGMEWRDNGKEIDKMSLVSVRLLERRQSLNNDIVPYNEKWARDFSNIFVPTGVWHGIKLGLLYNSRLFTALGESICELSLTNGNILWTRSYANTPIRIILPASDNKGIYVLYSGYQFNGSDIGSNLIKIGFGGNLIWSARMKQSNDSFTFIRLVDGALFTNTWNGWYGTIDEDSGEMIDPKWTR